MTYDACLRELDRGYFGQDYATVKQYDAERGLAGSVHYRFPGHDSLLDVYQRMSTFVALLHNFMLQARQFFSCFPLRPHTTPFSEEKAY